MKIFSFFKFKSENVKMIFLSKYLTVFFQNLDKTAHKLLKIYVDLYKFIFYSII